MNNFMTKDRWVSVGALAFSAWVYFTAAEFPKSLVDTIGSSLYPQMLAIIIAFCAVVIFLTSKPVQRSEEEKAATREKIKNMDWLGVVITVADLIMYLVCFKPLGFVITTILFCMIFIMYFEKNRPVKSRIIHGLIFSVIFTGVIYVLFAEVLNVLLPTILL